MKSARSKNIKVSVIIPAFNEEKNIENTLKSLAKQSYKKLETILVDDFSTDETSSIAVQKSKKFNLDLKLLWPKKHGERGIARNLGAKKAIGDYLLFIDADMALSKDVIKECCEEVKFNPQIKAIIIPEETFGKGFWVECRKLEKRCYIGDDRIEAARFFEKNAFWKVGGWDEKMVSGEDWDLTTRFRNNYKLGRIKSSLLHNEDGLTLSRTFKKKFYYASVSGIYLKKNPINLLTMIFFIFRPAYIRNWKLILSDPYHAMGMFILKGVELIAGGLGFLYSNSKL